MEIGIAAALLHIDIVVQDLERAIATYTKLLGYEVVDDCTVDTQAAMFLSGGAARRMRMVFLRLNARSTMLELVQLLDDNGNGVPASSAGRFDWNLTFAVTNLDAARAALTEWGLQQVSEEYEVTLPKLGTARVLYCRDTEGNLVELVGPK